MSELSRLALGTVQFGSAYGVSNRAGQPDEAEVAAILVEAVSSGVGYLDTAAGYGDAEALIGRHLPAGHGLRIVTKTPPLAVEAIGSVQRTQVLDAIAKSLDRLKCDRVHAVLVHHASELGKTGWQHVVEALEEAKTRGWTNCIGASVYGADDLALAESRLAPQLIQLPMNVLDQRLVASGAIARLKARGVEIHARSIFLQGLLLMEPTEMPRFFAPLSAPIADLRERWRTRGLSPLIGCLAGVLGHPEIDVAVVGVNRCAELRDIETAMGRIGNLDTASGPVTPIDPTYLDPRRWPSFAN